MALASLVVLLCSFTRAAAQSEGAAQQQPLQLIVRAPRVLLDAQALRSAIAVELGTDVELAERSDGLRVEVDAESAAAVRVALRTPDGRTLLRSIDVSAAPAEAPETIALLCANLLRDEAAELLHALRPRVAPVEARGCDPWDGERTFLGADVLPYVGSSSVQGTRIERTWSFHLFGGINGSVRGFELGGALNLSTRALCGVQLSWGANAVSGPVDGAQLGLVNSSAGRVDGLQLGLVDVATGSVHGAQLALVSVAAGFTTGAQVALANVASGGLNGAQVGLVNVAATDASGLQLGQVNVAAGGLRGSQVGLLNISDRQVSGAMVGLLNIAEDSDAAVGLLTILTRGRTHLDVWGTDAGLAMIGVEHGGKLIHNVYGLGIGHRDRVGALFAGVLGIGVRVVNAQRLFLDIDALGYSLVARDDVQDRYVWGTIVQLRVPVALRLSQGVALFVAPAMNLSIADSDEALADPALYGSTRISSADAETTLRVWPGFNVGLRLF